MPASANFVDFVVGILDVLTYTPPVPFPCRLVILSMQIGMGARGMPALADFVGFYILKILLDFKMIFA